MWTNQWELYISCTWCDRHLHRRIDASADSACPCKHGWQQSQELSPLGVYSTGTLWCWGTSSLTLYFDRQRLRCFWLLLPQPIFPACLWKIKEILLFPADCKKIRQPPFIKNMVHHGKQFSQLHEWHQNNWKRYWINVLVYNKSFNINSKELFVMINIILYGLIIDFKVWKTKFCIIKHNNKLPLDQNSASTVFTRWWIWLKRWELLTEIEYNSKKCYKMVSACKCLVYKL